MGSNEPYNARRVGSSGHEILGPDGTVIARTTDGYWASVVVALLNRTEANGLGQRPDGNPLTIR